jgi:hypothetical protein
MLTTKMPPSESYLGAELLTHLQELEEIKQLKWRIGVGCGLMTCPELQSARQEDLSFR